MTQLCYRRRFRIKQFRGESGTRGAVRTARAKGSVHSGGQERKPSPREIHTQPANVLPVTNGVIETFCHNFRWKMESFLSRGLRRPEVETTF